MDDGEECATWKGATCKGEIELRVRVRQDLWMPATGFVLLRRGLAVIGMVLMYNSYVLVLLNSGVFFIDGGRRSLSQDRGKTRFTSTARSSKTITLMALGSDRMNLFIKAVRSAEYATVLCHRHDPQPALPLLKPDSHPSQTLFRIDGRRQMVCPWGTPKVPKQLAC